MVSNIHEFVPAKSHASLSTGEVIRMLRELKEWTQAELANRSGISPTNLSALENDRVDIGKRRAEQLAKAFNIHPAIIMFPEYETSGLLKAA
ncbi:MAG: helix-turn-helix transcriptional regulator [Acidobacteria bacterium]|nr:helix-turn-helix transcriptional regulator [Acidobacteriota bacterium]